jgi:hypothetical protein
VQKQFLILFILGSVFFWGAEQSQSQVCRDAAGRVIPCPATEVPRQEQADRDGDGMIDSLDRCPTEGGPAQNTGCPEETSTVTETAPSSTVPQQAVLPTAGACVMATNGTEPVNRRDIPSSQGTIVGVIQPNEIFPINFALATSEGTWYNTSPFSWVLASVMRLGGDCSSLDSMRGIGQILPDFSAWSPYECKRDENPLCGGQARAGLLTSGQWPYRVQASEEQHEIFFFLFARPDGGIGLEITNRLPDVYPHPDDNPSPFLIDFDLVNYDPVIDPIPNDFPRFPVSIDDTPEGGIIIGIPNNDPGDPGYEPTFDITGIDDDGIDLFGESILVNPPLNEGCDLYESKTYYHHIEDIGRTYNAWLGSVDGYTMLDDTLITAWLDEFGLNYSTDSTLTVTRSFSQQQEFVMSSSGPSTFFDLTIYELDNYLTSFDVTVSSWTNVQPNKLRLNICVRYP